MKTVVTVNAHTLDGYEIVVELTENDMEVSTEILQDGESLELGVDIVHECKIYEREKE